MRRCPKIDKYEVCHSALITTFINWISFDFGKFVSGSLLPGVWNLGATLIEAWRRRWWRVWLSGAANSGIRCCYLAAKTTGNISIKCLFEGVGGHSCSDLSHSHLKNLISFENCPHCSQEKISQANTTPRSETQVFLELEEAQAEIVGPAEIFLRLWLVVVVVVVLVVVVLGVVWQFGLPRTS